MKQDRDYRGPGQYVVSTAMIPPPRSEPPPPPPRADGTAAYECQCCAESAEVEALRTELSTTRQERDEAKAEIVIEKWLRQNHATALAEVRRLHAPHQVPTSPDGYMICRTCDQGTPTEKCHMHRHVRWPCPTAAAVDALSTPPPGEGE